MITDAQQDELIERGVEIFLNAVRLVRADKQYNNATVVDVSKKQPTASIKDLIGFAEKL